MRVRGPLERLLLNHVTKQEGRGSAGGAESANSLDRGILSVPLLIWRTCPHIKHREEEPTPGSLRSAASYLIKLPCRWFTDPSVSFPLGCLPSVSAPPPCCPVSCKKHTQEETAVRFSWWQAEWMSKLSFCHRRCPQTAPESTIQRFVESQDHGPCGRPFCNQHADAAFLHDAESQVCHAKAWCMFLKESSSMKAFI